MTQLLSVQGNNFIDQTTAELVELQDIVSKYFKIFCYCISCLCETLKNSDIWKYYKMAFNNYSIT